MAQADPPGSVYWMDHFVVGTNDLLPWIDFAVNVLGMKPEPIYGLTTIGRQQRHPIFCFTHLAHCHMGGFLQNEMLPSGPGVGKALPRYGFYIREDDIAQHLRRLDQYEVPHSDPTTSSADGEEGTAISFEDPAGNQYELWAPRLLPEAALADCGPLRVGSISHAVLESRDLDRTAAFFGSFTALEPMRSADIDSGTLVYRLRAGGRLVFKATEELDQRARLPGRRNGLHTALTVRHDDFFPTYERLWKAVPEWDFDTRGGPAQEVDMASLPARSALHGSAAGRQWKQLYGRGDDFYDWDANCYHLVGGVPAGRSMAIYGPRYMEDYLDEAHKTGQGSGQRPQALSVTARAGESSE